MARIESERKGGFYPTPPSQVRLIQKLLYADKGSTIHIFDPCAGEGDALFGFYLGLTRQDVEVMTYAIELEKDRALEAQTKLDHVLQAPYEDTRVTPGSMSFLWLNPPYTEHGSERAEVIFLRDLTDTVSGKLQTGGLLGFCIPQKVLQQTATLLALRFENIQVYRFTDPEFSSFKQVVLFGYRRKEKNPDHTKERDRIKALAGATLPPLDIKGGSVFRIPPAAKEVQTFKANTLEAEEVRQVLSSSSIWETIEQYKPRPRTLLKMPAMPLKPTHIGVVIASGAVGGCMGSHILVGATTRVKSSEKVPTDIGVKIIETTESKSVIRLFDENGIHVLS